MRPSPTNPTGSIALSQIADGLITGPKLANGAILTKLVTGHNNVGACTATGVKVGDKVITCINLTDATDDSAKFESTITVADQLQQTDSGNLSAKKLLVQVIPRS